MVRQSIDASPSASFPQDRPLLMPRRAPPAPDAADVTSAVDAIRRILHALRSSSRQAETRAGVTGAQLFVLQTLAEAPAASLNELARRTLTHQSTVSVVVDRLVRRGLVLKRRAADDARRVELRLSPRGRALVRRSPQAAQGRLIDGLRALSHGETGELARLLRRLVRTMGAAHESASMFFEDTGRRG
jgi:MarR family transcriptional regulator, lower aerobic nicotinate degradation pathway regulator